VKFEVLVNVIQDMHDQLQRSAVRSVNKHLTVRNWVIGFYIVEFEQHGAERAKYGDRLLKELANSINIKGLSETNLKINRQFYNAYPHIYQAVCGQLEQSGVLALPIRQTPSDEFEKIDNQSVRNRQTPSDQFKNVASSDLLVSPEKLISQLSFSHFSLLSPLNNPLKRTFYEIECMKGNWSHSELKRQINSLYFERSGMSDSPEKLSRITLEKSTPLTPADVIKSPFTFEFLGLKSKDVVYESDLEQALIDHLEEFLLELGHGFCFEAKQKRITIGEQYYFIDLVFYHRILKCHVLIELKMREVEHENIGQLKTYIHYYKKNIMQLGDNPPIGLLLVTENNKELVEYAVADADVDLFVSKYMLELPSKQELQDFIKKELVKKI